MFVKINQLLYIFIMLLFLRKEMYNTKKAIIIVAFYNQSNWEAAAVYPRWVATAAQLFAR